MNILKVSVSTSAVLIAVALSGCDPREPATPAAPADAAGSIDAAPAIAPPEDTPSPPVPAAARAGVALEKLQAGQAWLAPRIVSSEAPEQPLALQSDFRYLLHPGMDAGAKLVVDVGGTDRLTLQPMIEGFADHDDCANIPDAGVVDLRWSLDGGEPTTLRVDRYYAGDIPVATAGAKQLEIEVLRGNEVIWCDWLAVGVTDVTPAQTQ